MEIEIHIQVSERDWHDSDGNFWIEQIIIFQTGKALVRTFGPIDLNKHLIMKTSESPLRIMAKGIPFILMEREATPEERRLFDKV